MKKGLLTLLALGVVIGIFSFWFKYQERTQLLQVGYEIDDYFVHIVDPETEFDQGKPLFVVIHYEEPITASTAKKAQVVVTKTGSDQILQEENWQEVQPHAGHQFALTNKDWEKGNYTVRFLRGGQMVEEKVITIR